MRILKILLKGALALLVVIVAGAAAWLYLFPPDLIRVALREVNR